MKATSLTIGRVTAAAGATVAMALVAGSGLFALGRPADLDARLARVAQTTERVERASRGAGDADAYPAEALCHASTDDAVAAAEQRVKAAASSAGLTLTEVKALAGRRQPDEPLAEVRLELEANGTYDATLLFLNMLARSQPEIFADTVDLGTKGPTVTLKFSGRLLCSTSARL